MAKSITSDVDVKKIAAQSSANLTKSKKEAKKLVRRAGIFHAANEGLRNRAIKQASNFYNSGAAERNEMEDILNTSMQFQLDFYNKFKNDPNWEQLYINDYMNTYVNNRLNNTTGLSSSAMKDLKNQALKDVEDDLVSFKKLLSLSGDLKLKGSVKKEELLKKKMEPYITAESKRMQQIIDNGNIFSKTSDIVGFFRKDTEELSPEEIEMQIFKDAIFARASKWDEAKQEFDLAISNNEVQNMFKVSQSTINRQDIINKLDPEIKAMQEGHEKHPVNMTRVIYGNGEATTSLGTVIKQLSAEVPEGKQLSPRGEFIRQIGMLASAKKYLYDKSYDVNKGMPMYENTFFVAEAAKGLLKMGRLTGLTSDAPSWYSLGGANATYAALDAEELGVLISAELSSEFKGHLDAARYEQAKQSNEYKDFVENIAGDPSIATTAEAEIRRRIVSLKAQISGSSKIKEPIPHNILVKELNVYKNISDVTPLVQEYISILEEAIEKAPETPLEADMQIELSDDEKRDLLSKHFYGVEDYKNLTKKQVRTITNKNRLAKGTKFSELVQNIESNFNQEKADLYDSTIEPDILFDKPIEQRFSSLDGEPYSSPYDLIGDQSGTDTALGRVLENLDDFTLYEIEKLEEAADTTPFKIAKTWWRKQKVNLKNPNAVATFMFKNPALLDAFAAASYDPVKFVYRFLEQTMPEASQRILSGEIKAARRERIEVMRKGNKEGGKSSLLSRTN